MTGTSSFPRPHLPLETIRSAAEYVLWNEQLGLVGEAASVSEAALLYYRSAQEAPIGTALPRIYKKEMTGWRKV